jgi:hypothetical protein
MEFDPSNVADVLRMTGLQQGMLFHCLVDEGSALYAAQYEWDLPDRLDLAAFGAAWRTVIARHAALRSSFEWEGVPQPVQIVWRAVDFDIEVRDLSAGGDPAHRPRRRR